MALEQRLRANEPGLPVAALYEINDMLMLALDASYRATGYTQSEREARSYVRAALRQVTKLAGVQS